MTDYELGWVVGVLESEGSFFIWHGYPLIQVRSTDEDVIRRLAKLLRCKYVRTHPPSWQARGWAAQFEIRVYGDAAREIFKQTKGKFSKRRAAKIKEVVSTASR